MGTDLRGDPIRLLVQPLNDLLLLKTMHSCDTTSNSEHEIKDVLSKNNVHSFKYGKEKTILKLEY